MSERCLLFGGKTAPCQASGSEAPNGEFLVSGAASHVRCVCVAAVSAGWAGGGVERSGETAELEAKSRERETEREKKGHSERQRDRETEREREGREKRVEGA